MGCRRHHRVVGGSQVMAPFSGKIARLALFLLALCVALRHCSAFSDDDDVNFGDQDDFGDFQGELGDLENMDFTSYEDGIGPGEDFGDYEDKYTSSREEEIAKIDREYEQAAKDLAGMLREQEESPDQTTAEDVVKAGLEDDSPAAHFDGVLDLDDVTFDKILAATGVMRWRLLVFMHAPWDQNCKDLVSVMRALGRKFSSDQNILIAKADVDRFSKLAARFDISTYTRRRAYRYPHFMLFADGDEEGQHYGGAFTVEDLSDFVLDVARAGLVHDLHSLVSEFMAEHRHTKREQIMANTEEVATALPPEDQEAAGYYLKTMGSVLEKGDGYVIKESSRLSGVIEDGKMAADKLFSFRKRLNVLRVFATSLHDEL